jgi:hypothetical protein
MEELAKIVYPGTNKRVMKLFGAVDKISALTPKLKTGELELESNAISLGIAETKAFKAVFGATDLTDTKQIEEWVDQWVDVIKLTDPITGDRLIKNSPASITEMIYTLFTTEDEAEYAVQHNRFSRFLQDLISTTEKRVYKTTEAVEVSSIPATKDDVVTGPFTYKMAKPIIEFKTGEQLYHDQVSVLKEFLAELQNISPEARVNQSKLVPVWTTLYQYKQEQMASLVEILTNDQAKDFSLKLTTGKASELFHEILNMNPEDTEFRNVGEVQDLVRRVIEPAKQFFHTKTLFTQLYNSWLSEDTRSGVISAIHKFFDNDPLVFRTEINSKIDQLIESVNTFIQQTKQADEALNLDTFFNKFEKEINFLRNRFGLPDLTEETHVAIDDTFTNLALFHDLAKHRPELQAMLDAKVKIVAFDFETQNTETRAAANFMHQYGILVTNGDKDLRLHGGLARDVLSRDVLPDKTYLDKVFPGYSDEMQLEKFLDTRIGDIKSEKELVHKIVKDLWDAVKDTYDEGSQT